MSTTTDTPRRLTVVDIAKRYADGERLPMLTAYDFPTAKLLDEAGIPLLLVGDSVGQVILGYESTVRVTMDEMLHHTKAVVRGSERALVIADMPFLSYATPDEALENAGVFLREAGAQAVKVEGGVRTARIIETLVRAGIPVMGHIGLTPAVDQHHRQAQGPGQGPRRRPARCSPTPRRSRRPAPSRWSSSSCRSSSPRPSPSACASRRSGSAPAPAAAARSRSSPTSSASATSSPGMPGRTPTSARSILDAAKAYAADVAAGTFPGPAETVRMDDAVLDEVLGRGSPDRPAGSVPVGGIPLDRDL